MTFSGEVRRGLTGTISLRRRSDQGLAFPAVQVTSAAVDVVGNQVTIRIPQALAEKTEYYVEVSSGAFTDAAGLPVSGIQGFTFWNFTTGDFTPPSVQLEFDFVSPTSQTSPSVIITASDGAGGIPNGTPVKLDLDRNEDGDFSDPGEMAYTTSTLIAGTSRMVIQPPLAVGNYLLRARATDVGGNTGVSDVHALKIVPPPPQISLELLASTVLEDRAEPLTFVFRRTGIDVDALLVHFTVTGSAELSAEQEDYSLDGVESFAGGQGSVVIPAGMMTAEIRVRPFADMVVEFDETLTLTLTAGAGYTLASQVSATGVIKNDDLPARAAWAVRDGQTSRDRGVDLVADAGGNLYVAGLQSFSDAVGSTTSDFYIAKYTYDGQLLWRRVIGSLGDDRATRVAVDLLGNTYVTGWFQGTVDFDSSQTYPDQRDRLQSHGGSVDGFILKLNTQGEFEWVRGIGGSGWDAADGVAVLRDGTLVVAGHYSDHVDFQPEKVALDDLATSQGGTDLYGMLLDSQGQWLGQTTAGGAGDERVTRVVVDTYDQIYVVGSFQQVVDFMPGQQGGVREARGTQDAFVLMLSPTGDVSAVADFGDPTADHQLGSATAFDLALNSQGEVYVIGSFSGQADFDPSAVTEVTRASVASSSDLFLVKLDSTLQFQSLVTYGNSGADSGLSVAVDAEDHVLLGGQFEQRVDWDPSEISTHELTSALRTDGMTVSSDAIFVRLSAEGDFRGAVRYGFSGDDTLSALRMSPTGSILLTGQFSDSGQWDYGAGSVPLTSTGTSDAFVVSYVFTPLDFGDAPRPYPTLISENGARHVATGPRLGQMRDEEVAGSRDELSTTDDLNGGPDDEDGVMLARLMRVGQLGVSLDVRIENAPHGAKLDAWIDFDGDGNWGGAHEQIFRGRSLTNGLHTLTFDVPSYAAIGTTYARFRLSTTGQLAPSGPAADGEVEDHAVQIAGPTASFGSFSSGTRINSMLSLRAESPAAFTTGDLHRDGNMDVAVVNGAGTSVAVFPHAATSSNSRSFSGGGLSEPAAVFYADLDGNGWLDLLIAEDESRYGGLVTFANQGANVFSTAATFGGGGFYRSVTAIDMDQDGDLELVGTKSNLIEFHFNDGQGQFPSRGSLTAPASFSAIAFIDLDRDHDLDIVLASSGDNRITWYENLGNLTFTLRTISTSVSNPSAIVAVDMDDDGDIDLLTSSRNDHTVAWYENDGEQRFTMHVVSTAAEQVNSVVAADLDGDGDLDILSAGYQRSILWFENDGGQNFTMHVISTATSNLIGVTASDLDQDGDLDVVAVTQLQGAYWFENQGDLQPPEIQTLYPEPDEIDVSEGVELEVVFSEQVQLDTSRITLRKRSDHSIVPLQSITLDTIHRRRVRIVPGVILEEQTVYYVQIEPQAVRDLATPANSFAGLTQPTDWSFKTGFNTPPSILDLSPADGAVRVATQPMLTLTMTESVKPDTGKISIRRRSDATLVQEIDVQSLEIVGQQVVIRPQPLPESVEYFVEIPATALRDKSGKAFAGFAGPAAWNFTTGDFTLPTIVSTLPAHNANQVSTSAPLVITFSEPVQQGSGTILIKNSNNRVRDRIDVSSPGVQIEGHVVTIRRPSPLREFSRYSVEFNTSGIFLDLAGNPLAQRSGRLWTFSTGDSTAPTLSDLSPADNATRVERQPILRLTFNETIRKGTGDIVIRRASDQVEFARIAVTSDAVTTFQQVANMTLPAPLAEQTSYYVEVAATAIEDSAGNRFAGISDPTRWNFTTGDFTPPQLIALTPSDNSTMVAPDTHLTLLFDEPVKAGSGVLWIKRVADGMSQQIAMSSSAVAIDGTRVTVRPSERLRDRTAYYIEIDSTALHDLSGNHFAGFSDSSAWNFTTADSTAPTTTIVTLAIAPSGSGALFSIQFSEPVSGFTNNDLQLTNAATGLLQPNAEGDQYRLEMLALADGIVVFSIPAGVAFDAAGNGNSEATISFPVDLTSPQVTAFERLLPSMELTSADQLVFRARFSEPVSQVDAADFSVDGSTTATVTALVQVDETTFDVTVAGGDLASFRGLVGINLSSQQDILDRVGNPLMRVEPPIDERFFLQPDLPGWTLDRHTASVDESGTVDRLQVVFTARPSSDVVFHLTIADEGEVKNAKVTFTFTPDSWNTPQPIVLQGVDDVDLDGSQTTLVTMWVDADQSDDAFDLLAPQTITVTTTDKDSAGLVVSRQQLVVSEAGTTDSLTVALTARPAQPVVLRLRTTDATDATEASVTPDRLTFAVDAWNTPQTVQVKGIDDQLIDGDQLLRLFLELVASESDTAFVGMPSQEVDILTMDDDQPGMTLSTNELTVSESGTTATFTVRLHAQPVSAVVLSVDHSDATEAIVAPTSLTFLPADWDIPQSVTITGVDDWILDGPVWSTLTVAVVTHSSDASFADLPARIIQVTTQDNDQAGFVLSTHSLSVHESGTSATFTVRLLAEPAEDVLLSIAQGETDEVMTAPLSVCFNAMNWNQPQTVTVTGRDDSRVDGDVTSQLAVQVVVGSSDPAFALVPPQFVNVVTVDDERAGLTLSPMTLQVTEAGSSDSFTAVLTAQPIGNVILKLTSSDESEALVHPTELLFTTDNWQSPQTIRVTGVDDLLVDGPVESAITVTVDANRSTIIYQSLPAQTIRVTTQDDDFALTTLLPADNATAVPITTNLVLTFNENVRKGVGNVLIKRTADDSIFATLDMASSEISVSGGVVTINPGSDLESLTGYYVQLARGAIEDLSGNSFVGISDKTTWNFTTADVIPPTLQSLDPADNALGVPVTVNLVLTFNENVRKGAGIVLIKRTADDSTFATLDMASSEISVSGGVVTINPASDLESLTGYYVQLARGAIEDLSSNSFVGISDKTTWNFTTAEEPLSELDFGDAPSPFPTLNQDNGARHQATGPRLGLQRDIELDGLPNQLAQGDDIDGEIQDEDGVQWGTVTPTGGSVIVYVSDALGGAKLDAWVDFNGDGSWQDAAERIAWGFPVSAGENQLTFSVPADAKIGLTYARFRLSTEGGLAVTGLAGDGEVEDHMLMIEPPRGTGILVDSRQRLGSGNTFGVSLFDADLDGDLDLFTTSADAGPMTLWRNDGRGYFELSQTFSAAWTRGVAYGDLDGDGDLDLVVASYAAGAGSLVLVNQGGLQQGSLGTFIDSGQRWRGGIDVALGDIDGDGDLDALLSGSGGDRVYFNQGGWQAGTLGQFVEGEQSLGTNNAVGNLLADLDGDGDLDYYQSNTSWQANRIYWNQGGRQSGTPGRFVDSGQALGLNNTNQSIAIDLDLDGDLDLIDANDRSQFNQVFINQGGAQGGARGQFAPGQQFGSSSSFQLAAADFDGDGDLDLITSDIEGGTNRLWLNAAGLQGGIVGQLISGMALGGGSFPSVAVGDLNGDGAIDLYLGAADDGHGSADPLSDQVWFSVASSPASPWQNASLTWDVNYDFAVTAYDALLIINRLNAVGSGPLTGPPPSITAQQPFFDVTGDQLLSPRDVLLVINFLLNQVSAGGEGEGTAVPGSTEATMLILPPVSLSFVRFDPAGSPPQQRVGEDLLTRVSPVTSDLSLAPSARLVTIPSNPSRATPAHSGLRRTRLVSRQSGLQGDEMHTFKARELLFAEWSEVLNHLDHDLVTAAPPIKPIPSWRSIITRQHRPNKWS